MSAEPPEPAFVKRLHVCVLSCKEHDKGSPHCLCIHNQTPIQDNAVAGVCLNPRGDQFVRLGVGRKADEANVPAKNILNAIEADNWRITGPLLWKELHIWALTAHLINDNPGWLRNFAAKIACGDCKEHWMQWTAANSPDFSSRDALFNWTVAAHNSVNERLGKPLMDAPAALRIWSAPGAPPIILTKGCGECGG